jgi:hypothetical protein
MGFVLNSLCPQTDDSDVRFVSILLRLPTEVDIVARVEALEQVFAIADRGKHVGARAWYLIQTHSGVSDGLIKITMNSSTP